MLFAATFIHHIPEGSILVVAFRKSLINPSGVPILRHSKTALKGPLPFIYALWVEMGEVGPGKYCEKEAQRRMWWCLSYRERSTLAAVNAWSDHAYSSFHLGGWWLTSAWMLPL